MRKLRFPVAALCLLFFLLPVLADKGGYVIDRFDVDLEIRPDSSLIVTERLTVQFSEPRHGYRPLAWLGGAERSAVGRLHRPFWQWRTGGHHRSTR